jgi:hypothetical protein
MAPTHLAPIFIVGVPRSGTTLLAAMLNAHPRLAISPETFFLEWALRDATADLGRDEVFREFWSRYTGSRPFADLGLEGEEVGLRFLRSDKRTFAGLFTVILNSYAAAQGKTRAGEKTPRHYLYIGTLLEWFPEARIAFVVRDPRAVAASLREVPWASDDTEEHAWRWKRAMEILARFAADPRLVAIRYETLVRNPRDELRRLCSHVGEAFDETMLAFSAGATALVAGEAHKENVLRPLSEDPLNKWKEELSRGQVAAIEYIAGEEMSARGYEPTESRPGWSARLAIQTRRATRRAAGLRRRSFGATTAPW